MRTGGSKLRTKLFEFNISIIYKELKFYSSMLNGKYGLLMKMIDIVPNVDVETMTISPCAKNMSAIAYLV